ncbi:MAG: type IX secretion system sortase PorU [bacterium]
MRRNNLHTSRLSVRNLIPLFVLLVCSPIFGQSPHSPKSSYSVISSTAQELIISVHPEYSSEIVYDAKTGEAYTKISVAGGSLNGIAVGEPAAEWIPIQILLPSNDEANISILKAEYKPSQSGILAPNPKRTFANDQFKTPVETYTKLANALSAKKTSLFSLASPTVFRTAYSQQLRVNPIDFDAVTNSISLLNKLVLKITFTAPNSAKTDVSTPATESELFQSVFANGNIADFYQSAKAEVTKGISYRDVFSKKNGTLAIAERWAMISTNDQGVYHLTASDLAKAGILNPDPNSLQLFGYGGATVPEVVSATSGELHECAIQIMKNSDGSLNEIRFYEPGNNEWYYHPDGANLPLYCMYHLLNPFTTTGHYLLRAGSGTSKVMTTQLESVNSPVQLNAVPVVAVHESENIFEDPGISREFLGEDIPNGRDATASLGDLPGYTPDSTILRPAFNAHTTQSGKHTVTFTINGTPLAPIEDYNMVDAEIYTSRNWRTEYKLTNEVRAQGNSLSFTASTDDQNGKFWLDFVEIFYRRQASLASSQVPFYVLADGRALQYNFTNASGGEAWDVSDPWNPIKISNANGGTMPVMVQGKSTGLRQLIAFSSSTLKSPSITATSPMTLHEGICQSGAEDIIVTPKEFLDAANRLAKQRRAGGQATPALSVAVVTTEDIYREFGYGAIDYSAIRDFLAYTLHHTTANNTVKPLYFTLFGNGHCDYRNKTTNLNLAVPIYENWRSSPANALQPGSLRTAQPSYDPDDAFYVQLTPGSDRMDVAVGRIVVHNADEADAFASKVIKYETSSDGGEWRARASFISDDRYYEDLRGPDPIQHIYDSKDEISEVPERILIDDIFGVAYPNTFTAAGRRKPDMERAVVDAFNNGSAVISWVGHGNPVIWANEAILTVPTTINKMTNFNRLAFLTTATCDFSRYDNYQAPISGGVQLVTKADGGVIASLGTCRSVFGAEPGMPEFYKTLLQVGCGMPFSTAPIGVCYVASRIIGRSGNIDKFFILGDPTQRLLIPHQFVTIDSINGSAVGATDAPRVIPALSQLSISGHVSNNCDGSDRESQFDGEAFVTLFDAPTNVTATTTFLASQPITDNWTVDGPILYHGTASVKNGMFRTSFIVPKDIKFDTANAKLSVLAQTDDNAKTALGIKRNIKVFGVDTARVSEDPNGPTLTPYIGSRRFKSGDIVPLNSSIIVDVFDLSGLNTSTSSIGHSFIAWIDDSTSGSIDLASSYTSKQDDYRSGTAIQQTQLPLGTHKLKVRAFDALNNVAFGEVEFTAQAEQPYSLYGTQIRPNPVTRDAAEIIFLQPAAPESPVDITVSIFSIIGQKVRELSAQGISQNAVSIHFDGRDDTATLLPDGTYVYRIVATERLSGVSTAVGGTFIIMRGQ